MSDMQTLRFYVTPSHNCSYLAGLQAKTLFVDPQMLITTDTYSQLSELGFRRSGSHIYRPHCEHCHACQSIRIPVDFFKPSKSQRRLINRNSDLKIIRKAPDMKQEYFALYKRYIDERHADGDMYPPTPEQFHQFLVEGALDSWFYEFRDANDQLVAVAVTDHLNRAMSALYTFYDPSLPNRSLGSYAILWQIAEAKRRGMDYLYLGYWVKACRKMRYKTAFRPLEMLIDGHWTHFRQESF
ncbi:MAG: arginyltransferase [Nitrincola lacisaponensis]|uniref:Aspartate/glutamate leucyltransferase n=1 Tax=Nitrincola lacisaponensis TaxID=267850 RepID=A0A063XZ60_9GAMM|nr:arginyltransferase [Nitrincola lacisaponensis]KDE39398.1 Leucyl/phenylalanyl-tRNA--protein transferase [Nitrincola lacisaponensis]